MNRNETLAFQFLLKLGYTKRQIRFSINDSPDFLTSDGVGWEVKPSKYYRFTEPQIHRLDYDTIILFADYVTKSVVARPFYEVLMEFFEDIYSSEGDFIGGGFSKLMFRPSGRNLVPYLIVKSFSEPVGKCKSKKELKKLEALKQAWNKIEILQKEWIGGWR